MLAEHHEATKLQGSDTWVCSMYPKKTGGFFGYTHLKKTHPKKTHTYTLT